MATCCVSDCERPTRSASADLCDTHYMRQRRTGSVFTTRKLSRRPIGHRSVRTDGYVVVKVGPGKADYQLEHRLVAEQMLGRTLATDEQVHHVNGQRADNRPENLVVMTNAEHQRHHHREEWSAVRSSRVTLTCKSCGTEYERKRSRVAESNYCSAACRMPAMREAKRLKALQRKG